MFHPTSFPSEWLLTNVQRISHYNTRQWQTFLLYITFIRTLYIHSHLHMIPYITFICTFTSSYDTSHSYVHSHLHSFISSALCGRLVVLDSLYSIHLDTLVTKVNAEINIIAVWLKANKMARNTGKPSILFFMQKIR
jgi:hypothetical protein